jgi:CheY-like chemotaxis protein
MQILLVDDEPSIVQLLTSYLTRHGHSVRSAATGQGALDLLDDMFELAVVDFTLPDISGLEVAIEILKRSPAKVVIASGYEVDQTLVPAEYRPRVRALRKPFMPKAILDCF